MGRISQKIYCAFCRLERRVCIKKSIHWTNVLLSLVTSFVFMYIIWQSFDARFILFFAVFLCIAEVFIRIRWRMSLPCPHCDFDPLLYKINREQAAQKVKMKLNQVRLSDKYLLKKNNPIANIPVIRRKKDEIKKSNSQSVLFSREV